MNKRRIDLISSGHTLLEGPRWRDGRLWVSDFFTERVLTFDADGESMTICNVPGSPSGLGWMPDGDLLVVSMFGRKVLRLRNGALTLHADLSMAGAPCNDMIVDTLGRAYVGNFGFDDAETTTIAPARLLRVDMDGSVVIAADDLIFPNGMAITADGQTLLVAETYAARITAFTMQNDGVLTDRRVWAAFTESKYATTTDALNSGQVLPDGIALDRDGRLWVADAGGTGAVLIEEGGAVIDRIDLTEQKLTCFAIAFAGPGSCDLYLLAATPHGRIDPRTVHRAQLLLTRVDTPAA